MKEKLLLKLMDFLKICYDCLMQTPYSSDKVAFQSDINICVGWLLKIHDDVPIKEIIDDILDSSTSKHFFDYYKEGVYGDIQAKGFADFQTEIELMK